MKLWLISQDHNSGYDTYDSAVVAADSEEEARHTSMGDSNYVWAPPEHVNVEHIGEAAEGTHAGIVCASFNAG